MKSMKDPILKKTIGNSIVFDENAEKLSQLSNEELILKIKTLEKDLERRQESYITRERSYQKKIDQLEDEINEKRKSKTAWMTSDNKIAQFKELQVQLIQNVDDVQERANKVLRDQERDLLRSFQVKLYNLQSELIAEKNKNDDGSIAWIEKCKKLEIEFQWAQDVCSKLEETNQSLTQENSRLKTQLLSHEEDRNFLVKQAIATKKENARLTSQNDLLTVEIEALKKELAIHDDENEDDISPLHKGGGGGGYIHTSGAGGGGTISIEQYTETASTTHKNIAEIEERYKKTNVKLKRMLTEEKRALATVRQNYIDELKSRTELEVLLRECLDDVRKEIALCSGPTQVSPEFKATLTRPSSSSSSSNPTAGMTNNRQNKSNPSLQPPVSLRSNRNVTLSALEPNTTNANMSSPPVNRANNATTMSRPMSADDRHRLIQKIVYHEKILRVLHETVFPITTTTSTSAAVAAAFLNTGSSKRAILTPIIPEAIKNTESTVQKESENHDTTQHTKAPLSADSAMVDNTTVNNIGSNSSGSGSGSRPEKQSLSHSPDKASSSHQSPLLSTMNDMDDDVDDDDDNLDKDNSKDMSIEHTIKKMRDEEASHQQERSV